MPVDFNQPAHIHVVHGVETGTNADIHCAKNIHDLLTKSLADVHVDKAFEVKGYLYENLNNKAEEFYQLIAKAITSGQAIAGAVLDKMIDLIGDVVIAADNTSTAHIIRQGLRDSILESYNSGNPCIVVAHSLGTVYSLDVVNELIEDAAYFQGDDVTTWPVLGLLTMGSPLGLDMDIAGVKLFEMRTLNRINGAENAKFPWDNYYNRLDPVVSGNVFGAPVEIDVANGPVELRYGPMAADSNWLLQGHVVVSGQQWLLAHTAYWNNPTVGDRIFDMLWG